jgi:type VI secretion system lysozyme-like protein
MPGPPAIIQSLFDRLTDDEPQRSREIPPSEWDQREIYKAGLARDLNNLLNTRRSEDDIPEVFESVRQSIAAYGMPDYTGTPMDQEEIRRAIERVIRVFEPRLTRVEVALDAGMAKPGTPQPLFRQAFRIFGVLRVGNGSEPVVYDASLPKELWRFQVTVGR